MHAKRVIGIQLFSEYPSCDSSLDGIIRVYDILTQEVVSELGCVSNVAKMSAARLKSRPEDKM